jgi:hypothetical protein
VADVFAQGLSSGSNKCTIEFWNLSIHILCITQQNKTYGSDFPIFGSFLGDDVQVKYNFF